VGQAFVDSRGVRDDGSDFLSYSHWFSSGRPSAAKRPIWVTFDLRLPRGKYEQRAIMFQKLATGKDRSSITSKKHSFVRRKRNSLDKQIKIKVKGKTIVAPSLHIRNPFRFHPKALVLSEFPVAMTDAIVGGHFAESEGIRFVRGGRQQVPSFPFLENGKRTGN